MIIVYDVAGEVRDRLTLPSAKKVSGVHSKPDTFLKLKVSKVDGGVAVGDQREVRR